MCSAQLADLIDQLGISPGSHRRRRPGEETSLPWRSLQAGQDYSPALSRTDRSPGSFNLSAFLLTDKCSTVCVISYSSLIKIDTGPFIHEFSKHFYVVFLNAKSVRNKVLDICDQIYIMQANVDLVFPCETWL